MRLAGELGFEPRLADPESAVLPLDYSPTPQAIIAKPLPIGKHLGNEVYSPASPPGPLSFSRRGGK